MTAVRKRRGNDAREGSIGEMNGEGSGGTVNRGSGTQGMKRGMKHEMEYGRKHEIKKGMAGDLAGLVSGVLIFCINGIGITGAFLETLMVDWRDEFNQLLLWGGLAALCAVSALWWTGRGKRLGEVWRTAVLACVYAAVLFLFGETIVKGFVWSFRGALEMFVEYYGDEGMLGYGAELLQEIAESGGEPAGFRTLGLLAVLFPFLLLAGLCAARGRWQVFLAENAVWLAVACITDVFPGLPFVALCMVGVVLAASAGEFGDSRAAWLQASAGIAVLTLLGVLFVERLALPVINGQYERSGRLRHEVYVTVNYKWLPGLQRFFGGSGFGAGVDVTGSFGRQSRASGITSEVYRVTLDAMPRRTLYLRGFVGVGYNRRKWEPEDEGALERYYRDRGFALPEDSRGLLNMGFGATEDRTYTVKIEELLGQGKYSLLPYGAFVAEAYTAHSGGTVDRLAAGYEFLCQDRLRRIELTGQAKQAEEQYRQYVYDSFLDYPEERLPQLTGAMEEAGLPRGDVYGCAEAILGFLEERGAYRLGVASTPVGKDFVEHFLFESHEGYCAHFAAAAVLMFRYCGIPARYATGYSVSAASFTRTQDDLYVASLTGAQAHAWAEVYVDGVGWTPVEATPGAAAFSGDNRAEMLRRLGILMGSIEPVAGGSVIIDDDEDEDELEENISLPILPYEDEEELEEDLEDGAQALEKGGLSARVFRLLLLVLPAGAALAVLLGRVRRLCWHRRLGRAAGREKVFLLYRNMRNALGVMGCPKGLALTGEAFWEGLKRVLPSQGREEYETLCDILEQSAFGNRALSGKELETLGSLHDDMVSRLYLNAPFYKKPAFAGLACVLPASYRTYSLKRF